MRRGKSKKPRDSDHLGVANPIRPEDLDRRVNPTWYLSFTPSFTRCTMEYLYENTKVSKGEFKVSLIIY